MSHISYYTADTLSGSYITDSLKENFENLLRSKENPRLIDQLSAFDIKQIAIGPAHVGVLTSCGKICRIPKNVETSEVKGSPPAKIKPSLEIELIGPTPPNPDNSLHFLDTYARLSDRNAGEPTIRPNYIDSLLSSDPPYILSRRARTNQSPPEIPERLIQQVENILQGRSRADIVRELIRSNLNVNGAVNRLLNQDDAGHDNFYSEPPRASIVMVSDNLMRTIQLNATRNALATKPIIADPSALDLHYLDCESIKWWESDKIFTAISPMYSDLVAIDIDGNLHQWYWACSQPNRNESKNLAWGTHNHSKAETLKISGEVVVQLSCSFSRGMALLKSNKIIYWMDSALWEIGDLEGSSYISSELKNIPVKAINCNNLYSVALLEDGSIWWWGILPFSLRNKIPENKQTKNNSKKQALSKSKIKVGSYVSYQSKSCFNPGAIAFYFDADSLKMGRLINKISPDMTSAIFVQLTFEITTCDSEISEKMTKKPIHVPKNRKRKYSSTSRHSESEEQEWPLSNVVFLSQKVSSVGVVVKMDKENVLVEFVSIGASQKASKSKRTEETCSLKNSRIFNIKDLKLIKRPPKTSTFIPNCQLYPKKLEFSKISSVLGIYSTIEGVYVLSKVKSEQLLLEYIVPSSKLIESHELIGSLASFGISYTTNLLSFKVFSKCLAINVPKMGVYILREDELGNYSPAHFPAMPIIKILDWSDSRKNKSSFMVMAVVNNPCRLAEEISDFDRISIEQSFYSSQNVIHFISHLFYISEVTFTKQHHLPLLSKLKNIQSLAEQETFKSLLIHRDLSGLTPFLYAVKIRSYKFAVHLYQIIKNYNDTDFLMDSLFPSDLPHYLNPIYLLCTNETCSFSWTGVSHQNQDVYECRTCGITDKLCCCSECAYTCHRGHDCIRKPRSPTAFCDCWEKCICQSLYNGDQGARKELFRYLISYDRLLCNIGVGSDHVMLYIIRTLTRHNKEVKNFKQNSEMIEDTEVFNVKQIKRFGVLGIKIQRVKLQSKFLSFAIKLLLGVKQSVVSLFTSDTTTLLDKNSGELSENISSFSRTYHLLPPQLCGRIYDCFIFNLFTRCDKSVSKVLFNTLKEHFSETYTDNIESNVLVNFIRSCARVYIVMISSMSPFLLSDSARRYSLNNDQYRVLYRIIFFFKRFPITAATELSKMAFALITPVMYGNTFHKNNAHCLYTRMPDFNEFLASFFSTSNSLSSINNTTNMSYYTRPTLHNHRTENMILLESEDLVVDDDGDEYYSEDEIDGASDGDDEYAVVSDVSDFNDEDAYPEEESLPSNPNPNFSDDDYPTVVDSNYHSNPSSESDQNTHDDTHNRFSLFYEPVSRLHDPSPFNILHRNELRPRSSNRNRSLPPNYQWAIRNGSNSDSARDSLSVIRSSTCDSSLNDTYLMISLQSGLARSFMLIVKIISDLCAYKGIFKNDIVTEIFNSTLGQVFLWMFDICESTEAKLRFGMQSLNSMVPSLQPGRWDYDVVYGSPENNSDGNSSTARSRRRSDDRNNLTNSQKNRNDFLGNLISILRSNDNDHFGILPYLDLTAFKHIAYMLDGFIYFLYSSSTERSENDLQTFSSRLSLIYNANDFEFVCKKFFSRTLSTLTYGYQSSDLSSSITDSLPLAVYPSILTSLSSKKDLFGSNKLLKDVDSPILQAPFNLLSTKLFTTTDRHSFISTILKLPPIDYIMRWNNLIDVFSQIFSDSIGVEASTIYQQFSRFEAKEFAFRLYIERIKSVASNELALVNLERINSKIILQTFKILNTYFSKRQTNVPCLIPPFSRIKALFKNEPGEGSGVTRNFFAFICQAITSSDKLPDLSSAFETGVNTVSSDSHTRNVGGLYFDDPSNTSSLPGVERLLNRLNRLHGPRGRGDSSWSNLILQSSINRQPVNSVHRTRRNISQVEESITLNQIESMNRDPESANSKQLETRLSLLLKKKLTLVAPELVNEVVEALLQLSPDVLFSCLNDEEYLKSRVTLILKLYGDLKLNTGKSKDTFEFSFDASVLPEDTCLFFQPGKPGFYFPTNAKKSLTRLNAYKNVGRIIGMAFYFNEVIPLVLCRPVIKFFLGHPLSFHDFAFYDPVQYESLRMLTLEAEKFSRDNPDQEVPLHGLNFCLNVVDSDENPHTIDLMPSGSNIPVTSKNVNKYVQAYVEYLILFSVKPELTAIRDGIHEVLHPYILQSLNSEDFRLLLNGSFEVLVSSLKKIVAFTDEASGLSPEKMERFQNWFWSVVESLNPTQRGELLQFWTSSPLLSEIETTPKPNITIKPCSNHLPTSNTCVMRLYLPAYKKKSVLKSKLLLAIKTRTFGFI